jgi:hypothetical protein
MRGQMLYQNGQDSRFQDGNLNSRRLLLLQGKEMP